MKLNTLASLAALVSVLVLCTGCPYESKYSLTGEPVNYSKDMIGTWYANDVELEISTIHAVQLKVHYDDHEEGDPTVADGTAKVVRAKEHYLFSDGKRGRGALLCSRSC